FSADSRLSVGVILAFGACEALAYTGRFLFFTIRLARDPRALVRWEIAAAIVHSTLIVAFVLAVPTLAGLIAGLLAAALANGALGALAFLSLWVGERGLHASRADVVGELRGLVARRGELF